MLPQPIKREFPHMKNEKGVKQEVKKILNRFGAWHYMPVQTGYGVQGIPDFVVCLAGLFVSIETKFGSNKPTAWQEKQGAGIVAAQGVWLVINEKNVNTLEQTLLELLNI